MRQNKFLTDLHILALVLLAMLLIISGCGGSSSGNSEGASPDDGDNPPSQSQVDELPVWENPYLTLGNYWLYSDDSFEFVDRTVSYRDESYLRVQNVNGFSLLGAEGETVDYDFTITDGYAEILPHFPSDIARKVNSHNTEYNYIGKISFIDFSMDLPWRIIGSYLGEEDVTTPAGGFSDCFKMELNYYYYDDVQSRFSRTIWVAPGIGTIQEQDEYSGLVQLIEAKVGDQVFGSAEPSGVEDLQMFFEDDAEIAGELVTDPRVTVFELGDYWQYSGDYKIMVDAELTIGGKQYFRISTYIGGQPTGTYEIFSRKNNGKFYFKNNPVDGGETTINPPIKNLESVKSFDLEETRDRYEHSGNFYIEGTGIHYIQNTVFRLLKYETVTVPAGTFADCKKILESVSSRYNNGIAREMMDYTFWHKEGVGIVRTNLWGQEVELEHAQVGGVFYGPVPEDEI